MEDYTSRSITKKSVSVIGPFFHKILFSHHVFFLILFLFSMQKYKLVFKEWNYRTASLPAEVDTIEFWKLGYFKR